MITLVNYGLGNVRAFINIYNQLGVSVKVASNPEELLNAKKIILPGVGAFDAALTRLNESGMRECLDDLVQRNNCLVLGICVGMQIMARCSDEGKMEGLGWIDAEVKKFNINPLSKIQQIPHMGWNDVLPNSRTCLFQGIDKNLRFYFLHSYYMHLSSNRGVLATTDYNGQFSSAVRSKNIFGVQFHPEKSHQWGIQLLKNFARI